MFEYVTCFGFEKKFLWGGGQGIFFGGGGGQCYP